MTNAVTAVPAAPADAAQAHFAAKLAFETDCADVQAALATDEPGFVLLDVRGPGAYAAAHVPGATSLPYAEMTAERLSPYPDGTLFVVYCAGPHCNGADKAAARLASLGRPVKLMIGGMTGWRAEGFALAAGDGSVAA